MVNKLKKAHQVTHALKKDSGNTGYGADMGDLFDDFSAAPKKVETKLDKKDQKDQKGQKDKAKEEEVPELKIESSKILN